MRINKELLLEMSFGQATKEGMMYFKANDNGFKERWFKLRANLLFIYPKNTPPSRTIEPVMGLVMENFVIQTNQDMPNKFCIYFQGDPNVKYNFFCMNSRQTSEWLEIFRTLSYRHQRVQLNSLRSQITQLTGLDPLQSTPWSNKQ